jgi:hypothetical protein
MTGKDIERQTGEALGVPGTDLQPRGGELLATGPRVVIYGQLTYRRDPETGQSSGGAWRGSNELVDALMNYLGERGVSVNGIIQARQLDNINNAFYRGWRAKDPGPPPETDSIPSAVFVLPEMRGYYGGGFSQPTPVEKIRELCERHGVPMAVLNDDVTPAQLQKAVAELPMPEPPALPE